MNAPILGLIRRFDPLEVMIVRDYDRLVLSYIRGSDQLGVVTIRGFDLPPLIQPMLMAKIRQNPLFAVPTNQLSQTQH